MNERTDTRPTLGGDAPKREGVAERLENDAHRHANKANEGETSPAVGLADLLLPFAPRAVSVLASLMQDEGQKPELRMKAAESILDRACGKGGGGAAGPGEVSVRFEGVLDEWSR